MCDGAVPARVPGWAVLLCLIPACWFLSPALDSTRAHAQDLQPDLPEESGPVRVQPVETLPQKPAAGLPQEEKPEAVPVPEIPQERPQVKHEERPEPKALNRMVNRLLNILTADNGTNRTAVVGRVQFLTEYRERRDSSVQLSNTARVDIPLAANLLWRTDADLTLYDPRTDGNSPSIGTGDVSTRLGTKVYEQPAFTTFVEAQVVFPTATNSDLGRGRYQFVPAVFFSVPIQKLDMAVFPGIQQDVSVGGDPSRKSVNFTKLNLEMTKPWANSLWWTTFEPVLYIDWTQKAKTALDLEFEVGRRLGDHWRAWIRPAVGLWGTGVPGSYDWYTQIGIRYMF